MAQTKSSTAPKNIAADWLAIELTTARLRLAEHVQQMKQLQRLIGGDSAQIEAFEAAIKVLGGASQPATTSPERSWMPGVLSRE